METFISAIGHLTKPRAVTSEGIVTAIEGTVCTVEREGRAKLEDVRMHALEGGCEHYILITPKIGSSVLVLEVENQPAETAIVKYTEIDKVEIKIKEAVFSIENGKIGIKNKEADLLQIITGLLDQLSLAVIQTPSGPGMFSASDKKAFKEYNNQINQLLL